MMHRLIRFSMVGTFALAISTAGLAYGQDDPDEDAEEAVEDTEEAVDDAADDSSVSADADVDVDVDVDTGKASGKHGLILPKGKIAILAPLNVNLSSDLVAKPISLSPDVWYGVNDKLSAGLTHSFFAASGFLGLDGLAGTGICFTGEENGCGSFYDNVGVDAVYALSQSDSMELAANGGVQVLSLDPLTLALKVGVKGMWRSGKLGVLFNPNIFLGVTERDNGNEEVLNIPVAVGFEVNPKLHAMVQSGITGTLSGFGDNFAVPVTLAAHFAVSQQLMVGGAFSLPFLISGNDALSGADARTLSVMVGYML